MDAYPKQEYFPPPPYSQGEPPSQLPAVLEQQPVSTLPPTLPVKLFGIFVTTLHVCFVLLSLYTVIIIMHDAHYDYKLLYFYTPELNSW